MRWKIGNKGRRKKRKEGKKDLGEKGKKEEEGGEAEGQYVKE